jgi:hypothetical protein
MKLTNISLATYRRFLTEVGCKCIGIKGGYEKWEKQGLTRPIIVQTHIDPVPIFVIKNTLRNLEISNEEFFDIINK